MAMVFVTMTETVTMTKLETYQHWGCFPPSFFYHDLDIIKLEVRAGVAYTHMD